MSNVFQFTESEACLLFDALDQGAFAAENTDLLCAFGNYLETLSASRRSSLRVRKRLRVVANLAFLLRLALEDQALLSKALQRLLDDPHYFADVADYKQCQTLFARLST